MKQIPPTVALLLICQTVRAQPKLDVAFKGGVDAATQEREFRVNRYGFSGGLSGDLQWMVSDNVSLGAQAELLYTQRGAKVMFEGEEAGQIRSNYVDLVLGVRPQAGCGAISVYALNGGSLNVLTNASRDDAAGPDQDITEGLHRVDVAVLGAAGVALQLPSSDASMFRLGTVFVEARHDIGLLDVDRSGGFKNRTSSVMLGLSFVVGGKSAPDRPASQVAVP